MTQPRSSIQPQELLKEIGWVYRLARHLLGDTHQVEDAVQETWLVALESPPRDRRNLRGWLATVLRNVVGQKRRSDSARRQRETQRRQPASFPAPEEVAERAEIHRDVVNAVLRLKEPYQSTILYQFFEDRSPGEIAAHSGVPASTVRTRLERGLEQLRCQLDRTYGDDRRSWCLALAAFTRSSAPPVGAAALSAAILKSLLSWPVAVPIALALAIGMAVLFLFRDREPEPKPVPRAGHSPAVAPTPAPEDRRGTVVAARTAPAPRPEPPERPAATPRDRVVSGTVRDGTGAPIKGAVVRAMQNCPPLEIKMHELARTRTNEKGEYEFGPLLYEGMGVFVEASRTGFFKRRDWVLTGTRHDFVLGLPGSLTGRILVASDRSPCADATVMVFRQKRTDPFDIGACKMTGQRWQAPDAETRTDSEGRYRLPDLVPGDYFVAVSPPRNSGKGGGPLEVHAGRETVKDLTVPPGEVMWGVVRDARTGKPISGARILTSNFRQQAVSNERGEYRLPGIVPGHKLQIYAGAEGYVWKQAELEQGNEAALHLDCALDRAGLIRGQVLGPGGNPLAGASVAFSVCFLTPGLPRPVQTDPQGRFELAYRDTLTRTRLRVRADGLPRLLSDPIEIRPGEVVENVRLQMKAGGTLEGRVMLDDGKPAAWAMLLVRGPDDTWANTFTGDDGRYCVPRLHPGVYAVDAFPRGAYNGNRSTWCRQTRQKVGIVDGAATELDFVLPRGTTLTGEVVDNLGQPLVDMPVYAVPENRLLWLSRTSNDPDMRRTHTDAAGRFRIEGLQNDRTYSIHVMGVLKGLDNGIRRQVTPGTGRLRLELPRMTSVSGQVVLAGSGRPASRFWIELFQATPGAPMHIKNLGKFPYTHPEGRFNLSIHPGTYRMAAGTSDGLLSEPQVLKIDGKTPRATISFEVSPAATLKGSVLSPKGRPGVGTLSLYTLASTYPIIIRSVRTDSKGKFEMKSLAPGRYYLGAAMVTHPRWAAGKIVSVAPGGLDELLLQYEIAGELRVSVRDPEGRPVRQARVFLKHEDGRFAVLQTQRYRLEIDRRFYPSTPSKADWNAFFRTFFVTDETGTVHPRYPAAGRYVVEASAPGFERKQTTAVMQSGHETRVELTLNRK